MSARSRAPLRKASRAMLEAIVRDVAMTLNVEEFVRGACTCVLCRAKLSVAAVENETLEEHEKWCTWRRARALTMAADAPRKG